MKRINRIEIENARAYYDRLPIALDRGENLLLYGENGSGKTSLYKSLRDFIQSFYAPVEYTPNRYKAAGETGEVMLSIGDYDEGTNSVAGAVNYSLAPGADNTHIENTAFMKALALSKGFLNYRDLLKVYLYDETDPNLFDFFVNHLLGNHVPVAQGRSIAINKEWNRLNVNLYEVHDRRTNQHRLGLSQLAEFEVMLRSVLDNLFDEVNQYLDKYFDNFELAIDYELKPMDFLYHRWKWEWEVVQDLRLKIALGDSDINDYTEGLNEARLSAIAICLYLAALRANPGSEMRMMFLDDIFIGIDSSNRWPILRILENEFADFQIIIATYDRSWYCLARNYLMNHRADRWKCVNLFSLPKQVNGQNLFVPVLTVGTSDFDKAKEYLHGQRPVDLPAAANYFRKALEDLISEKNLPKELFLSDDYSLIPGFKLTKRVGALTNLFMKTGEDATHVMTVETYLHPLIHPLSHHEEEAQVYRRELMAVENAIAGLYKQIESFNKRCKLLMGRGNKVEIHYNTADGNYRTKYQILFEENVWLYKDAAGNGHLTDAACRCVHMEGVENGQPLRSCSPNKRMRKYEDFCYTSLDNALAKIYDFEVNHLHHAVVAHNDYDIVHKVCNRTLLEPFKQKRDELMAAMV